MLLKAATSESTGIHARSPRSLRAPFLLPWLLLLLISSPLLASEWQPAEEGAYGLHSQCWTLGGTLGRVDGLSGDLARLAGPDDGVIILEFTQNDYLTPYTSREYLVSLYVLNNFSILQGGIGYRWSTVPFPKTFLRPWVGAYLTFSLLEDDRDISAGNDEYEGAGVGVAASVGVTMKLSRSLALEAAVRGDQIVTLGHLESGDFFQDEFRMHGVLLRFVYLLK